MNNNEVSRLINQVQIDTYNVQNTINNIENDIKKIQDGDNNGAYWAGKNAFDCIKTALLQIEYNKDLLSDLEKNMDYLQSLNK